MSLLFHGTLLYVQIPLGTELDGGRDSIVICAHHPEKEKSGATVTEGNINNKRKRKKTNLFC